LKVITHICDRCGIRITQLLTAEVAIQIGTQDGVPLMSAVSGDFCGLKCLNEWLRKDVPRQLEDRST
jgi:hypothetical protein